MEISYRLERLLRPVARQQEEFTSFVTSQQSNERQYFLLIMFFFFGQLLFLVLCIYILWGVYIYRNAFYKGTLFVEGILGWSFWIKRWPVGVEIRPWSRWNCFIKRGGVTHTALATLLLRKHTGSFPFCYFWFLFIVHVSDINQWLWICGTSSSFVFGSHLWIEDHLNLCNQDLFWLNFLEPSFM